MSSLSSLSLSGQVSGPHRNTWRGVRAIKTSTTSVAPAIIISTPPLTRLHFPTLGWVVCGATRIKCEELTGIWVTAEESFRTVTHGIRCYPEPTSRSHHLRRGVAGSLHRREKESASLAEIIEPSVAHCPTRSKPISLSRERLLALIATLMSFPHKLELVHAQNVPSFQDLNDSLMAAGPARGIHSARKCLENTFPTALQFSTPRFTQLGVVKVRVNSGTTPATEPITLLSPSPQVESTEDSIPSPDPKNPNPSGVDLKFHAYLPGTARKLKMAVGPQIRLLTVAPPRKPTLIPLNTFHELSSQPFKGRRRFGRAPSRGVDSCLAVLKYLLPNG